MDKMRSHGIPVFLFFASVGILPAQLTITTSSLPSGPIGVPYNAQLQVSGANGENVQFSVYTPVGAAPSPQQGNPPPGLTLQSSGLITGTPTMVGSFPFQVVAQDQMGYSRPTQFDIEITACAPTISPSNTSPLPGADVGINYPPLTFTATGCPGSYTFAAPVNGLPPGLGFSSGGLLTGKPNTTGTFSFTVTVNGPNNYTNPLQYMLTVNPLPSITTPSPLPSGPVGVPYSQQIAATGGTPGPSGYSFSMNSNPPGITITRGGLLGGTPTQTGTFQFNIGVEDSLNVQTVSPFTVSFISGTPQVQVSPLNLTFNAAFGGNSPPTQAISVLPATGSTPPVNFTVLIDSGPSNASVPSWISVSPTNGTAPAGLVVSVNQGTLATGMYPARIRVLDSNNLPTDVAVTLNVNAPPQQLVVSPSILRYGARAAAPGILVEDLLVSNAGAGALAFTTSVLGASSWISGISPSSGQATSNTPLFLQVQVNTSGLQVGGYHDVIQLASSVGNVDIPVSLFVAAAGPLLTVNTTGVLFQARQNGGSSVTDNIEILNIGDLASMVDWTASLVSGSNWLTLVSSSGTATSAAPGVLSLALAQNATQLSPGPYYALVEITDPNSLNSPQFVSAVLDLEPDSVAPSPYVFPAGLFFSTPATLTNGALLDQVFINTSSASPVPFQAAATTSNQGSWLSATPSSGNADGQTPGRVNVSVNPTGLSPGIYTGNVNISISQALESVNVTVVVLPPPGANQSSRPRPEVLGPRPEVTGCTPSKLAITETSLPNNFAVPAGWPATLIVQLNDDCGSPVLNGSVIATFSNGDAALALVGDSLGNYSATWAPGAVTSEMVITVNAAAGTLQPATATLNGGISQNPTPPPTLVTGGTLNNLNPVVGGSLSPGTIAQVHGSGLATSAVQTGVLPLPTTFNNTFAQVGAYQAPLFYLSNGQVNVQLPYDLTPSQQLPILLSVNNALTLPVTLDIVPTAPGVLSDFDGPTPPSTQNGAHIIAQHSNGSLVTSNSPATPGEDLVMYLVGLGATKPSVPSGAATPNSPLSYVNLAPTVTVDSQPATLLFAGLTPAFVGLYQIDFQVPAGAHSGDVVVTVTQNGVAANPTLLPVSP
jgi:uncharacterized protein (TIGR03437 family)